MAVFFITNALKAVTDHVMMSQKQRRLLLDKLNIEPITLLTDYSVVSRWSNHNNPEGQGKFISIYDFFQETVDAHGPKEFLYFNRLKVPDKYEIYGDSIKAVVQDNGVDLAVMYFFDVFERRIRDVLYYDSYHRPMSHVWYDYRGFKSSEEILNPEGKRTLQRFFNAKGEVKIQMSYDTNENGYPLLTGIWLDDYHGQRYDFDNFPAFLRFFYEEIAKQYPNSTFLSDQGGPLDNPLFEAQMDSQARRYEVVHDRLVDETGDLNQLYAISLNNYPTTMTGVVAPNILNQPMPKDKTDKLVSVPFDSFTDELPTGDLKKDALDEKNTNYVYLSRYENQAGIQLLIETITQLPVKTTMVVIGSVYPTLLDQLKEQAKAADVELKLVGVQNHDRLLTYIQQADALIIANEHQSYSFTLGEARRLGTPVVVKGSLIDAQLISDPGTHQVTDADQLIATLQNLKSKNKLVQPTIAVTEWKNLLVR